MIKMKSDIILNVVIPTYKRAKFLETIVQNLVSQIELAHLAVETAKKGIPVLISNHDTEFTRHQYRHGQIISFSVPAVATPVVFFDQHITTPFLASSISAYPRGSPPLNVSFTPVYLRTLSLRI